MTSQTQPRIESRCSLVYVGDAWAVLKVQVCHTCKQCFESGTVAAIEAYPAGNGVNYRPFHVDCIVEEILEDRST